MRATTLFIALLFLPLPTRGGPAVSPGDTQVAGEEQLDVTGAEEFRAESEARRILSDPRFQTEFPDDRGPVDAWTLRIPALAIPAAIGRLIMYALVAGAVLALLLAVGQVVGGRLEARRRSGSAGADDGTEAASGEGPSLERVRELAAAGSFDEAIHLLLAKAFALLIMRGDVQLPESLTGREVLRRTGLSGDAGAALRTLVESVEESLFGGRRTDATGFHRCWTAYTLLSTRVATGSP